MFNTRQGAMLAEETPTETRARGTWVALTACHGRGATGGVVEMNPTSPRTLAPHKEADPRRWRTRFCLSGLGGFALPVGGLLLVGALLLASCDSSRGTLAPTVVQTSPIAGAANVPTDSDLRIGFSEAMAESSVKVEVDATHDPGLDSGRWTDAETIVFKTTSGWQIDTDYSVSITGRNLAGTPLAAGTSITFHTAAVTSIGAPAMPGNVRVEAGDGSFDLTWDANHEPDLDGYTLYWGPANGPPDSALFVAAPATSATVSGVNNAQPYDVTVDAIDIAGHHSEPTAPVTSE